jgi:hypothetical protein
MQYGYDEARIRNLIRGSLEAAIIRFPGSAGNWYIISDKWCNIVPIQGS